MTDVYIVYSHWAQGGEFEIIAVYDSLEKARATVNRIDAQRDGRYGEPRPVSENYPEGWESYIGWDNLVIG